MWNEKGRIFYKAVQRLFFHRDFCVCIQEFLQFQLGHPDRYLLEYFERDIQNKSLTREGAQLILDCLGIQINNRVPNGLSSGYMVGGRDKNNNIVQNELTNFEGHEQLRNKIIKAVPKYGNDIDEADEFFAEAAERIIEECKKYTAIHSNGSIIPSVFCWVMHEHFGSETGATPDGRLAGFPLGDGSGPCQGREMNGPTASVLSSTKWSHCEFIGGVAVNMKFAKKSLGASSVETIKNLVKVYLKRGGFEMQINVVDKKTLERAVTNPEEYRDLVVRIGGYSDNFSVAFLLRDVSMLQNCFCFWYSPKGNEHIGIKSECKFNSVVNMFTIGFCGNEGKNIILETEDGNGGIIRDLNINDKTAVTDETYKKYLHGTLI